MDAEIREGMRLPARQRPTYQHMITKIAPRDFADGKWHFF